MFQSLSRKGTFAEPFLPRHPWVAALLFGTVATPAGIILGWLAPRPLDAVVALPLVLLDIWVGPGPTVGTPEERIYEATLLRLFALVLGIVLTWLFYVLMARLVLWRLGARGADGDLPG
jgi:hypothetical protein